MKLDKFFRCVGGGYGEAKARFRTTSASCASLICSRAMTACKT